MSKIYEWCRYDQFQAYFEKLLSIKCQLWYRKGCLLALIEIQINIDDGKVFADLMADLPKFFNVFLIKFWIKFFYLFIITAHVA